MRRKKSTIEGKESWIGTNRIYGAFSASFYKKYYGDMLSSLSHGKAGTGYYRFDRRDTNEPCLIIVPEFNLSHSFTIINHLIPVIYGYLVNREAFFEGRLLDEPISLKFRCVSPGLPPHFFTSNFGRLLV